MANLTTLVFCVFACVCFLFNIRRYAWVEVDLKRTVLRPAIRLADWPSAPIYRALLAIRSFSHDSFIWAIKILIIIRARIYWTHGSGCVKFQHILRLMGFLGRLRYFPIYQNSFPMRRFLRMISFVLLVYENSILATFRGADGLAAPCCYGDSRSDFP